MTHFLYHKKTPTLIFSTLLIGGIALHSSANAVTEIDFWHAMGGARGETVAAMVEDFNQSQSEYKVNATQKGNYTENMTAGIAAFRSKQQPHILQVFEVGTATMMAAKGAIKPVHEIMGDDFDISKYLAPVVGYYSTTDGKLLSLPFNSSTPVLYYNKDLFASAGIDSPPTTWEEMPAVAAKLKDSGIACAFSTAWQSWVHLENLSAWHNTPYGTQENGFAGIDTQFSFNSPLHVKHLTALADWQKAGTFKYGGRTNKASPLFISQECAMFTESSAGYAGFKKSAEFELGISSLPYWAEAEGAPQNTIIGGATLWVFEGHSDEEYQGVKTFFDYLSSTNVQAKWHQDTGYLPITYAAYEQTKEQGFYEQNPGTETALIQMTSKAPTANSKGLRFGNYVQVRDILDEEFEEIWAGSKTPQEALDDAVERGNSQLRQFEKANK